MRAARLRHALQKLSDAEAELASQKRGVRRARISSLRFTFV